MTGSVSAFVALRQARPTGHGRVQGDRGASTNTIIKNHSIQKARRLKIYEKIIIYCIGPFGRNSVSHHPEIRLLGK